VLCDKLGIRQSMDRTGSCFDNAAADSFFSTLEHEVLLWHAIPDRLRDRCGQPSRIEESSTVRGETQSRTSALGDVADEFEVAGWGCQGGYRWGHGLGKVVEG
jgi:transposase InsO family protein